MYPTTKRSVYSVINNNMKNSVLHYNMCSVQFTPQIYVQCAVYNICGVNCTEYKTIYVFVHPERDVLTFKLCSLWIYSSASLHWTIFMLVFNSMSHKNTKKCNKTLFVSPNIGWYIPKIYNIGQIGEFRTAFTYCTYRAGTMRMGQQVTVHSLRSTSRI